MTIVKILRQEDAEKVASMGYVYHTESIDGKTVYCFIADERLISFMSSQFTGASYFLTNRMNF